MRLFTGIAIGREVVENLDRLLRELRPLAPINWSPLENLHITSKFIGAWPEGRLDELTRTLSDIEPPAAFAIRVAGFGYLPNSQRPRMLFAGIQAGPELATLATRTEDALERLGVTREQSRYKPHLTLARMGEKPVHDLREHIASMNNPDLGTFPVSEFHLYSSRPRKGGSGSVYEILTTFPLGARS